MIIGILLVLATRKRRQKESLVGLDNLELAFPHSEALEIHKNIRKGFLSWSFRQPATWLRITLYMFPAILLAVIVKDKPIFGSNLPSLAGIQIATIWLGGILFFAVRYDFREYRKYMLVSIRLYLQERGIRVCMQCGHDLRKLQNQVCPKCNPSSEDDNEDKSRDLTNSRV